MRVRVERLLSRASVTTCFASQAPAAHTPSLSRAWLPAELGQGTDVEQPPRGAVRLVDVPQEVGLEADDLPDELRQLLDGQVLAGVGSSAPAPGLYLLIGCSAYLG